MNVIPFFQSHTGALYHGDSLQIMKEMAPGSTDLVVTSPPYAGVKREYGTIHPDKYVQWFLPFAVEIKRVLKSTGSFVLVIKEKVIKGERHPYVDKLKIALREEIGFRLPDTLIWVKKNGFPGYWPNRLKDGWEYCFHFALSKGYKFFPDAVKMPIAEGTIDRKKRKHKNDGIRTASNTGSGFRRKQKSCLDRDFALPPNVITLAPETKSIDHPAPFPVGLPEFFIKLMTEPGDLVLDPFAGSGTTCVIAKTNCRNWIGIDKKIEYMETAKKRVFEAGGLF